LLIINKIVNLKKQQDMDAKQHLYYSMGIMAYAIAMADGEVNLEEKEKLEEIVSSETKQRFNIDYASIIFQILEKDKQQIDGVYNWAIEALKTGKHYLTQDMKNQFISVINKVAEAFPPITKEERELADKFLKAIEQVSSDVNLPLK
jgi:uncharacterized tellurite resistance protein B-like protein